MRQIVHIPFAGATLAVLVTACSDDSSSSDSSAETGTDSGTTGTTGSTDSTPSTSGDTPTSTVCSNADVAISANHGHTLAITSAQIEAGEALVLTLAGPHTHELSLTAADVEALAACGTAVETSSTTGGHTHTVTLTGIA